MTIAISCTVCTRELTVCVWMRYSGRVLVCVLFPVCADMQVSAVTFQATVTKLAAAACDVSAFAALPTKKKAGWGLAGHTLVTCCSRSVMGHCAVRACTVMSALAIIYGTIAHVAFHAWLDVAAARSRFACLSEPLRSSCVVGVFLHAGGVTCAVQAACMSSVAWMLRTVCSSSVAAGW